MLRTLRPGIVSRVELALSPRHRFERHTGAIFAALFFVVGVAVSGDIGITADERETTRAAVRTTGAWAARGAGGQRGRCLMKYIAPGPGRPAPAASITPLIAARCS